MGDVEQLREAWDRAVTRDRPVEAAAALFDLERLEPDEPRWSHRLGEALRRMGRTREAEEAFVRATERYVKQGFLPRAIAMAKIVAAMNPAHAGLLARLDPTKASQAARAARFAAAATAAQPAVRLATATTRAMPAYQPPQHAAPTPPPVPPAEAPRPALLRRAEDSSFDEVRFEDADPDSSLDVTIDEFMRSGLADGAEGTAEDGPPSSMSGLPEMREPSIDRLDAMNTFRLFAGLPREALLGLADAADLVELPAGTMIIRRRDPADSLFAIVEGMVSIQVPKLPTIYLGEGHVVGEGCLLEQSERQADVRAETALMALRIDKTKLDEVVNVHSEIGDALFALLARRLVTNLLNASPLFTAFEPHVRVELAQLFEIRRAAPGTVVCARGKRTDGMYVLLAGTVTATSDRGAMRIAPGAAFGHASLLGADPAELTVESMTEAILLRLPASKFASLAASYPAALAHLAQTEDDAVVVPESRRAHH